MGEQPESRRGFVARIGTFFLLIGIGLMIFFFLSDADVTNTTTLNYFCWGVGLIIVGLSLQRQFKRAPGPPSGRFSILNKMREGRKSKDEKK